MVKVKGPSAQTDPAENGFKRLGVRLSKVTKRSPFSAWLAQGSNFESLSAVLEEHGVRWDEIAKWAQEEGHTGGNPITAVTTKRAFEREQAKRKAGPKQRERPTPKKSIEQPKQEPAQNVSRPTKIPYGRKSKGKSIWRDDE